jgi:TolB protein
VAFVKDDNLQVIDLATREVRAVTSEGLAAKYAPDWSPDGRRLVYAGDSTFSVVPATGGASVAAEPTAMLHSVATPAFSPTATRWRPPRPSRSWTRSRNGYAGCSSRRPTAHG